MTVLRSGVAVFVSAARPSYEYGSSARMYLRAAASYGFVQFGLPADLQKGATILSAKLRIAQYGDWSGSHTLTARRVTGKWSASKVNWNNQPPIGGTQVNVTQGTTGHLAPWEFDVAEDVQAWTDRVAPNYGWRIVTTDAGGHYFNAFKAAAGKPTLEITYTYAPAAPTSLHPSAGAVSIAKPVLRLDAGDITALQVQVDPAANGTTPGFDSGWVSTTATELDLATTSYAGLALNASTQWRVRVRNAANLASPWSQWVTFNRVAKQTLTITQPTGVVLESTPPIMWTMPNMVEYRVTVARTKAPTVLIHDSGQRAGTVGAYTPSKPVFTRNGESYIITVGGWDAVDREYTRGDLRRSEASVTVTLTDDPGIQGVTYLTAQQKSFAPWVDLVWSRAAMPDGWVIARDGERIHETDTPGDLNVAGNVYTFRDWTAAPHREHTYIVAPVENGVTARGNLTETVVTETKGVWLGDPETGADVMLFGTDDPEATYGEEADTFAGIGSSVTVDVVTALRGLEGNVSGLLINALDRVATDDADTLFEFKGQPTLPLRLAWGATNIPVTISNVQPVPRRMGTNPDEVTYNVSFSFKQDGELPFEADL